TRLSKDNTISCATCHSLDSAGVDKLQFSKGIKDQIGGINAPTVFNAAFHMAQFWDGRSADLQAQAGGPPFDMLEMGSSSWDEIIAKLAQDKALTAEFISIYPEGYSGDNITDAIAEFEKTLITPNSRFDLYLKGDQTALTAEEVEGYELFKANNCATCHVGQAMGGQSYEYMGIVADYFADREMKADRDIIKTKDQGHFNASGKESDLQRFKTPSLRNVALTAPYMHDGTINTLEEATKIMLKYQLGKELSDSEVNKIVKFMHTLNGQYNGKELN
ncbi:MAG: cytochrome-c peroxidase, partial [Bacteroidales bacterium]